MKMKIDIEEFLREREKKYEAKAEERRKLEAVRESKIILHCQPRMNISKKQDCE